MDDIRKHPQFQKMLRELRKHRKEPKLYHPKNEVAVDQWKYDSGWIAGFDFLYDLLGGKE